MLSLLFYLICIFFTAIPCATPVIHNGDLDMTQDMVLNNVLNVTCHTGYAITATDTQTMTFQGQFHCGTDEPLHCTSKFKHTTGHIYISLISISIPSLNDQMPR